MESPVESLEDVFQTLKHIAQGNSTVAVSSALFADNTDPFLHSPSHIEIRKFSCKTKGREKYVRRVYANFKIMKKYRCVGWVFDSDLENCMICGASFGLFKRKHHCRTCGDLVCTDCSEGEVIITEYPEYGYVKACNNCYFGQDCISVFPESLDDKVVSIGDLQVPAVAAQYVVASTSPRKLSIEQQRLHDETAEIARLRQETASHPSPSSLADTIIFPPSPTIIETPPKTHVLDKEALEAARARREAEQEKLLRGGIPTETDQENRRSLRHIDEDALEEARKRRESEKALLNTTPTKSSDAERLRRETEEVARIHRHTVQAHVSEFARVRNTLSSFNASVDMSGGHLSSKPVAKKRPISRELERMTSSMFGTLKLVEQGLGCDDATKTLMSFAQDESGEVHVWRVCGEARLMVEVHGAARGVFCSTGCYAFLYRCKNGARNILFVWVGADSTPDVRAALSIQCVKVSGNDVAADHVQVSQGSEPPLLSAVCMAKLGHPLCVVSGLSAGDPADSRSPVEVFLDVSMTHLGLEGHCASAYQLEDGSRELRIEGARVRLQVDLQKLTCSSGVTVQSGAPVEVVQGARSIAKIGSQIAAIVLGDRLPVGAELQLVLEEEVVRSGGKDSKLTGLSRPVRLFRVSSSRRDVGAIFVEEISAGGGFVQSDLQSRECFLLDSGRREVFAWLGRMASWHCRALCMRVGKKYVESLKRPHDPCATDTLRAVFQLPAEDGVCVEPVEGGEEPRRFVDCFKQWKWTEAADEGGRLCFHWDPDSVSEDESEDLHIAPDGSRIEENVRRARYSDTHVYKHNVSPPASRESGATREDFREVSLHHTPSAPISLPTDSTTEQHTDHEDFRKIRLRPAT